MSVHPGHGSLLYTQYDFACNNKLQTYLVLTRSSAIQLTRYPQHMGFHSLTMWGYYLYRVITFVQCLHYVLYRDFRLREFFK